MQRLSLISASNKCTKRCGVEFLIFWIGFSILIWVMAEKRDRSGILWFLLSLIISPLLAVLFLLVAGDSGSVKCPHCVEKVKKEAKVCKHCGSTLKEPELKFEVEHETLEQRFCAIYERKGRSLTAGDSESSDDLYKSIKAGKGVDAETLKYELARIS